LSGVWTTTPNDATEISSLKHETAVLRRPVQHASSVFVLYLMTLVVITGVLFALGVTFRARARRREPTTAMTSPHPIRTRVAALVLALATHRVVTTQLAQAPAAQAAVAQQLTRYPYLTDVVTTFATVNWATDRSQTNGSVKYGSSGRTARPRRSRHRRRASRSARRASTSGRPS
jgi:hypothetical protein